MGVVIIFHIRHYHLLYRILGSECYHVFYNNHTLMIVSIYVIFFYRIQTIPILHASAISVCYPGLYRMSCIHLIRFHKGLATLINLSHFYMSHYLSLIPLTIFVYTVLTTPLFVFIPNPG